MKNTKKYCLELHQEEVEKARLLCTEKNITFTQLLRILIKKFLSENTEIDRILKDITGY